MVVGGRVKMKGGGRLQTSVTEGGLVEEVGVGVNEKGVCRVQSLMTSVVNFTNRLAKGTGGGGVAAGALPPFPPATMLQVVVCSEAWSSCCSFEPGPSGGVVFLFFSLLMSLVAMEFHLLPSSLVL